MADMNLMGIRLKTVLYTSLASIVLIMVLSFILEKEVLNQFHQLDIANAQKDIQRLYNLITSHEKQISEKVADYAKWDESFKYINNKNIDYEKENINEESLSSLGIDFGLWFDSSFNFVAGHYHSNNDYKKFNSKDNLVKNIQALLKTSEWRKNNDKLLSIDEQVLILSVGEVSMTDNRLNKNGYIVFGHFFDEKLTTYFSELAESKFELKKISNLTQKDQTKNNLLKISFQNGQIESRYSLKDIENKYTYDLVIKSPRSILAKGKKSLSYVFTASLLFIFCFLCVLYFLVDRIFIRRIHDLSAMVHAIADGQKHRIDIDSNDEIGYLAKSLNHMMSELHDKKIQLMHQSKMSSLGEVSAGIAHEINNPLAIIQGYSESIRKCLEMENLDRAQLLKFTDKIEKAVSRIVKIVRGLKTFSRDTSSDVMQLHKVGDIINDTLDLCRDKIKNSGVELRMNEQNMNISIFCHPTQISQILLNLINNSFDAIVHSENAWLEIAVEDTPTDLKIMITDSGDGISKDIVDKLMQPFFTTKEVGKGTGLGLSISNSLAESHGGKLYYDSTSTKTRFVLQLPIAKNYYAKEDVDKAS